MMKKNHPNGFTMAEILVAMLLLAAMSGIAFTSFNTSAKWGAVTVDEGRATDLARAVLENLNESVRADQWTANNQPLSINNPSPQPGNITVDGIAYARAYTVVSRDPNGDSAEDFRRATVTVNWTP